jgi:hypothetical protein
MIIILCFLWLVSFLTSNAHIVDLKFYQFTIPNVNNIFNVLDIIEIVMYMLGIIGCFKASSFIYTFGKRDALNLTHILTILEIA